MSLSTRQLTEKLRSLQEVDLEIRKLRKEEARWPAILASRGKEAEAKRRKLQEVEETLKAARLEISRKELDLKAFEGAIRNLQVQQNTAKTNKEYSAFTNEIAVKKAEASKVEEDVLRRMDALEEIHQEIAAAKAALDASLKEQEKLSQQAASECKEIGAEIRESMRVREERLKEVPPDVLQQYERISNGRNGAGLAAVVDGVCQGCFISLTAQEINLLLQEDKLISCRNCSRILFFEGEGPGALPDRGDDRPLL